MPQYCDTNKLEIKWYYWLLASSVPSLEPFRKNGVLWTKVIGQVCDQDKKPIIKNGKTFQDATYPTRLHCISAAKPIFFQSENGIVPEYGIIYQEKRECNIKLPTIEEFNENTDSLFHELGDNIFIQTDEIIPSLLEDGYVQEVPAESSWLGLIEDINKMCMGIATKFNLSSEEETNDLANEALIQVMKKMVARKLVYIPGRAPVFNLLTTTILRCMFSIMNKRKTQRNGIGKIIDSMNNGYNNLMKTEDDNISSHKYELLEASKHIRDKLPEECIKIFDILSQTGKSYEEFVAQFGNSDPKINQIAEHLNITTRAVKSHKENIRIICLANGLIPQS